MSFAYWIAETNEFGPKSLSELGLVPKHRSVHDIIADIKREQDILNGLFEELKDSMKIEEKGMNPQIRK